MNINEDLKMKEKFMGKLVSKGVIRPTMNILDSLLWVQICSTGPLKCKKILPSKINALCYMKCHGLHGNPLFDFKEWGVHTKILISQQQLIVESKTLYQTIS